MKKIINVLVVMCLLTTIFLFNPLFVDNAEAIGQHEASSGTTYGYVHNVSDIDTSSTLILRPNSSGVSTELTIGGTSPASTNWESVCEETADDDETYVYTDGGFVGWKTDIYSLPNTDLGSGCSIYKITIYARMYVDFSNANYGKIILRTHNTNYSTTKTLHNVWTTSSVEYTTNPFTLADWTWDEIVAMELGFSSYSVTTPPVYGKCTQVYAEIAYYSEFNVSRSVYAQTESNNCSFTPSYGVSENVTLKIPVSTDVKGIVDVINNTGSILATEVNTSNELLNNTFWYDSANQFVYIRTINLTTSTIVNWTINCSYGVNFNLIIPPYLEVGQYFHSEGFISDSEGNAISGMIAETRLLYANGTDALLVNPKHNCTNGNYKCTFSTGTLIPGVYSVSIEFTDPTSGIVFKEGGTLYLSVDPGDGVHVSSKLCFSFYDNNTGIGIGHESFKIYASDDTTIDSTDRIYFDNYNTYTGDTVYYRIDDYFDNQIYPSTWSYQTLSITSISQIEDIPIDWYSFSVKNMNHSIVKFLMTNGSRTYPQFLFPYEPFYWNVLPGEYTINLTYYNAVTDAIESYSEENITISDDTYYWIRGYDLRDIIIEIQVTNSSLNTIILNVETNIGIVNSTVNNLTATIIANISIMESNLTSLINNVWNQLNITDSMVDYLNTTVNVNILRVNTTINYINDTVWRNFTLINRTINNTHISIITSIDLSEQNLTSLQLDVWTSLNLTDSIVDYLNNTMWNEFTVINTTCIR